MTAFYPSDQFGYSTLLSDSELERLTGLRAVLDTAVQPLLADYWEAGEFPSQIVPALVELDLMNPEPSATALYGGFRNFELARTDASVATFYNAQSGLFRTTVTRGGSPEQAVALDPKIQSFEYTGVFALTEPEHGSDIAGGLATSARRTGDSWVINGQKRWIGGATSADVLAVFARDEADGQVKAFLVPTDAPGVTLHKIQRKTSLRIMQNADIDLTNVRMHESDRLQRINSFTDVAALLRSMRSDVAWIATGLQAGAYEAALRYVSTREQFGKPLSAFQLTQQQEAGVFTEENSALAKMFCCERMRHTVALAREVVGGNGITLDTDVARFHADAEAVYSYEGTHEINSLIVGRAVTGQSAFI